MDESEFDRLIRRYQQNLLSDNERIQVEDWFGSFSQAEGDQSRNEEHRKALREKVLARIRHDRSQLSGITEKRSKRAFFGHAWRIAAGLLLLSVFTYLLLHVYRVDKPAMVAAAEVSISTGVEKVRLSDGSLVWLKGNSTLTYPTTFSAGPRKVTLKGEGLFEVAPDVNRPFIIQCGDLITTVLGTSFNIKSSEDNIEVVVLTGKVSLTSETDPKGIIVMPREKAMYWKGDQRLAKVENEIEKAETRRAVAGTEYPMYFEDTRMDEVARRIEAKFDVVIHAGNEKLMNCMITADFTGQPLERTLDMIAQALGAQYEINDGDVVIRGTGCDQYVGDE